MSDAGFYGSLETSFLPLSALLREEHFCALPDDWHVVLADVRNSTGAVKGGGQQDVNLVAAGALIAALNVARNHAVEVPFFFGGDGGTLIVPEELLRETMSALIRHARNSKASFGLSMYVGSISVQAISDAGHFIKVAKTRMGNGFCKALVIGDGLGWAERQIKSDFEPEPENSADDLPPDMNGLQCRWDKIAPPKERQQIICYLIQALDPAKQLEVYAAVLRQADFIFGSPEMRTPVSLDRLRLKLSVTKMRREMLAKFGRFNWVYFIAEGFFTLVGKLFHGTQVNLRGYNSAVYLSEIISNADTLTLDGRINTIISGTTEQAAAFLSYLDACERENMLCYGHHENRESIMTCYIQSFDKNHIHFVDGADGGYTAAATELKQKIAYRNSTNIR